MRSESIKTSTAQNALSPQTIARPRLSIQLNTAERRLLLIIMDLLLINGALIVAVTIWNGFHPSVPVLISHAKWFVTLSIVWLSFGVILDAYNLARASSTTQIIASSGLGAILTAMVYLFIPWLTPPILSRSYAFGFLGVSTLVLVAWRTIYAHALVQPAFYRRALILGSNDAAMKLLGSLNRAAHADNANPMRGTGYQVLGLISDDADHKSDNGTQSSTIGNVREMVSLARLYQIDEIIVALDHERALQREVYDILLDCRELGFQVTSLSDVYERLAARLPVEYARRDLQAILSQSESAGTRLQEAAKRLADIAVALAGLAVLGFVTPFVALCNAMWSPGPLFYRQQRVGKASRPFVLLKFRSMRPDAEQSSGAVWCGKDDDRVTPVGRWMRKLRVDELPQVINVLRGEMSVVGPRPERPHFVGLLASRLPLYRARHIVKPGITGWAQVHYPYGASIEDARIKLEYDLYYVKRASLYLDLVILLKTLAVVLRLQGR